jgi:hypothetical protein
VKLKLAGSWTRELHGVHFAGNTSGRNSVGYAAPTSGDTLDVPATAALGFGVHLVYRAPSTGRCFGDTPNITQAGRFAAGNAQVKIQLSKCADRANDVVMECRFAGALTPATVFPVISSRHLISKHSYVVRCTKSPDSGGRATVTLSVSDVTPGHKVSTTRNSFHVAATGALVTTKALSVGNKYPVPVGADNTDQFVGTIDSVVYCAGSLGNVRNCLTQHLPT